MMTLMTHQQISQSLCGEPVRIKDGASIVRFTALPEMAVDEMGLVHGGFIFGLADYAAMIAVNHPHVVLGAADVKFLKPVKVGDEVTADATITASEGKKRVVSVRVRKDDTGVFEGSFTCFILDRHVLSKP
jgi:uncharacterized protein (TIGR00369 family)